MEANTLTGNTGSRVQDGLTRASWIGAVQALLAFSIIRWDWATGEELALLEIPITFVAVAFWGLLDRIRTV